MIYSAIAWWKPLSFFQPPRVKSGTATGALPFSIDNLVSSAMQHHSAKS